MTQGLVDFLSSEEFSSGAEASLASADLCLAASRSSGLASLRSRTILWPSGDQAKSIRYGTRSVSRWASPPWRLRSQTWGLLPWRVEMKARDFPSGLQRGCSEVTPSAVIGSGSPPEAGIIQMRDSFLSVLSEDLSTT